MWKTILPQTEKKRKSIDQGTYEAHHTHTSCVQSKTQITQKVLAGAKVVRSDASKGKAEAPSDVRGQKPREKATIAGQDQRFQVPLNMSVVLGT